ncbi:hypothetical protein LMF32_00020 [Desemzia sp. C1]|uniref:hypothetical protein n=1 Tax=Desemzia sp. C1 TaxID=2892016 RepID=UPI001E5C612B|nr:hypothetical protein [Desemzia sp. C1]MCI3027521.1 hypothetical protein [Desemzia sp. C1]
MLEQSYWKVVLRYGHVGQRKEVYVARYLAFNEEVSLLDVCECAKEMPGVKHSKLVSFAKKIDYTEYLTGKESEKENFYLQKLKTFNQIYENVA